MIPFQERKKMRNILYSKITLAVLFVVLFFVVRGAWGIHQKAQIAISERDIARHSLEDLEARATELSASVARLNTDAGKMEEIRQKFDVALHGEEIVRIVDDNAKKGENGGVAENNFWQQVTSFFGF